MDIIWRALSSHQDFEIIVPSLSQLEMCNFRLKLVKAFDFFDVSKTKAWNSKFFEQSGYLPLKLSSFMVEMRTKFFMCSGAMVNKLDWSALEWFVCIDRFPNSFFQIPWIWKGQIRSSGTHMSWNWRVREVMMPWTTNMSFFQMHSTSHFVSSFFFCTPLRTLRLKGVHVWSTFPQISIIFH